MYLLYDELRSDAKSLNEFKHLVHSANLSLTGGGSPCDTGYNTELSGEADRDDSDLPPRVVGEDEGRLVLSQGGTPDVGRNIADDDRGDLGTGRNVDDGPLGIPVERQSVDLDSFTGEDSREAESVTGDGRTGRRGGQQNRHLLEAVLPGGVAAWHLGWCRSVRIRLVAVGRPLPSQSEDNQDGDDSSDGQCHAPYQPCGVGHVVNSPLVGYYLDTPCVTVIILA